MTTESSTTETVVRNHVQAFVERKGIAAIVRDYADDAQLHTETRSYRGKDEIAEFFANFVTALPDGAIDRFALRTLRVDGDLAYITWSAGAGVPLGTDTFLVRGGKIVSQTVAVYAATA
jgi:ketosteroid isomerase-like protein